MRETPQWGAKGRITKVDADGSIVDFVSHGCSVGRMGINVRVGNGGEDRRCGSKEGLQREEDEVYFSCEKNHRVEKVSGGWDIPD